jgi:glutathione-regulated potassium-efflux system ancillary protein KefG
MKTLILFAHPRLEKSKINKALIARIPQHPDLYFNDLYEAYPDFNIDIEREKELLLQHDMVIWQHPFYWYSCPPLLKQWIDLVLEFGWAYGPGGNALTGKKIFNAVTTGGASEAYQHEGRNRFTVQEFLAPFDQTANLCKMQYLPPFAIQGTFRLSEEGMIKAVDQYERLIQMILNDQLDIATISSLPFMNKAVETSNT